MKKLLTITGISALLLLGCQQDNEDVYTVAEDQDLTAKMTPVKMDAAMTTEIQQFKSSILAKDGGNTTEALQAHVASINESLVEYGLHLEKMEVYSAGEAGITVFFNDRGNKQLNSDYVPNDPRNLGGETVPYIIDGSQAITASGLNTIPAINSAMSTWDAVTCSDGLTLPSGGVSPNDIGFVSSLFGFGGSGGFFPGVIVHAGMLPPNFFSGVLGSPNILGVAFTFVWNDDIDNDGRGDVAVKEIYYNNGYNWQDAPDATLGSPFVDFETVALHETGHALSQAHFGKAFTNNSGKIKFAPYAVMNAGYTQARRVVEKTDNAGHCSNWGNWPNN
ncbi:hypothetical protein [Croceiramulus getboli]|nr:hypothetical protein P8624_02950 [Flavobacteriaceae bacterium YJPT1-3]